MFHSISAQVVKIKDALNKYVQSKTISAAKKKGITVGSTEIFQGQGRRSAAISVAIEHTLPTLDGASIGSVLF